MVQFDNETRQIKIKIVYYGPALGGKTTCLKAIHRRVDPQRRTKLYSLNTSSDRTLFFDLLALDLGSIRGFRLMVQLFTVPGQVQYAATRKAVLLGVDGLVFVADSQASRLAENRESLQDLKENLAANGIDLEELPIVFIYNKQDLAPKISTAAFENTLNLKGRPSFGSVATTGTGVMESFATVCESTLAAVADRLGLRGNTLAIKRLRDQARMSMSSLVRTGHAMPADEDVVVTSPLGGTSPDEPLPADALVGEAVRANLAMADLNTRLDSLTRLLEHKIRVMEGIRSCAETVSAHADPAAVLRDFLRSSLRLIEVASAAVLIVPGTGTLREVVAHGLRRDPLLHSQDETGRSFAVGLLEQRRPVLISRDAATGLAAMAVGAVEAAGFTSALAVPMLVQEREVGLLTAYTTADRAPLDEDDLHLSSVLAATGAMAYVSSQALRRVEHLSQSLAVQRDGDSPPLPKRIAELERDNTSLRATLSAAERAREVSAGVDGLRADLIKGIAARLDDILGSFRTLGAPPWGDEASNTLEHQSAVFLDGLAQIEGVGGHLRSILALSPSEHTTIEVAALIRPAMEPFRDVARRREIRLSVSVAANVKQVTGDVGALATALRAVVDNAIRYNHRGGEVRLEAKVVDRPPHRWVAFVISDSGVGIAESGLPKLFETFRSRRAQPGPEGGGLGMGLAVARQIFVNHGGEVRVESWLGRGTAVTLWLPLPH